LPRAGSISDNGSIFAFDGADALLRAWGGGLKPDPLLTVSEWADRYRMLSSRAAAEPGRYRTKRTPYMKDIMDALLEFQSEVQHRGRMRYPSVAKQKTVLPCQDMPISPPRKGIGSPI
jgi:hypothetical protein